MHDGGSKNTPTLFSHSGSAIMTSSEVRYCGKGLRQERRKLQANTLALVLIIVDWFTVDNLALRRFGIESGDSRWPLAAGPLRYVGPMASTARIEPGAGCRIC